MQPLPPNFVRRRACRTSCIATARICVHHLPGSNSTNSLLRDGAWKYVLRTLANATQFPPSFPVAISDSTTFSASSGGLDAYNSGLACVLYSFATHLSRTLGFPGCTLSISTHPVLMSALRFTQARLSPFPQAEQFLLIVVHEFLQFILHVTCSFILVVIMNDPSYPLFVSFSFSVPFDSCLSSLTCRAVVTVQTLMFTNPGPRSLHAANPNMHKSATIVLVPGMAMITVSHIILECTADVCSWRPQAAYASYNSHNNSM